jgi:probable HAF family extracellular repeat protein
MGSWNERPCALIPCGGLALLTACLGVTGCGGSAAPVPPAAGPSQQQRYSVTILGRHNGFTSNANTINDKDWVGGLSYVSGGRRHATLWTGGRQEDLGTLGGPNSAIEQPNTSVHGVLIGTSDTSDTNPYAAGFCGSPKGCLGFVWRDGHMKALPTWGGPNGTGSTVNDEGQIVGYAETAVKDKACGAPRVYGFLLDPKKGMEVLPPLSGDVLSGAIAINNRGQVVGASGPCPLYAALLHPVLWQNEKPTRLPTLGGSTNHIAFAINEHGEMVGWSDLPGDATDHGVVWSADTHKVTDLGTLPGDIQSEAYGINNRGQIVGPSCRKVEGSSNRTCHAFLYENGKMIDLNTLIAHPNPRYVFAEATAINDDGNICGDVIDKKTHLELTIIARPTGQGYARKEPQL